METLAASSRVCLTFELVQAILSFLTVDDLIFAQRVCRLWHNIIQTTPRLQELMFFEPYPLSERRGEGDFIINPLLQAKFPRFFESRIGYEEYHTQAQLLMAPFHHLQNARDLPNASWRRMLVVQPPVDQIQIQRSTWSKTINTNQIGRVLDTKAALRMGWLYDFCWNCTSTKYGSFETRFWMLGSKSWKSLLTLDVQYFIPPNVSVGYNPRTQRDHQFDTPSEVTWDPIHDFGPSQ